MLVDRKIYLFVENIEVDSISLFLRRRHFELGEAVQKIDLAPGHEKAKVDFILHFPERAASHRSRIEARSVPLKREAVVGFGIWHFRVSEGGSSNAFFSRIFICAK